MHQARRSLAFLLVSLALLAFSGAAPANIWPLCDLRINVQPLAWPPPPPLTTCVEIVSHTPEMGLLEFDLYMIDIGNYEEFGIDSLIIGLEWEESWSWSMILWQNNLLLHNTPCHEVRIASAG